MFIYGIKQLGKNASTEASCHCKNTKIQHCGLFNIMTTMLEKPATSADYFNASQINRVYGLNLKEPESLSFSDEEMATAKRLGMVTVLFTDKNAKGEPLTGKAMCDQFGNELRERVEGQKLEGEEKFFCDTATWYQEQPLFTLETPAPGYGQLTRIHIPDSTSKTYLDQTGVIAKYVRDQIYDGEELPETCGQAIEEYKTKRDFLEALTMANRREGIKQSVALRLNQMFRPTAVELMYVAPLFYRANGEYLLPEMWTWTKSLSLNGGIANVGCGSSRGMRVVVLGPPWFLSSELGVIILRRPLARS